MRFQHIFHEAFSEMQTSAPKTLIFITVEKADQIASLSKILAFKKQIKIDLPERADRKRIIEGLVPVQLKENIDMLEVAKYL